jgi:hypothetical protein
VFVLCGKGCLICGKIMLALVRPLWFCRLSRVVREDRRVVRRHLIKLLEKKRVRIETFGGVVFYKRTDR